MTNPQLPTYSKSNRTGWVAHENAYRAICDSAGVKPEAFPPNATLIEFRPDGTRQFRDVNYDIVEEKK